MNCAFCQAENRPTAKFCSDCGSPLGLQFCPKCETVSDKGAAVCTKCGYALSPAEAFGVGDQPAAGPALPPQPQDAHSLAKETRADNWHELLQSLEEEVHCQLDLQTGLATQGAAGAASRLAPGVNPLTRRRIAHIHEADVIEPTPSLWGSPGLWLVLACATGGCFLLLSLPSPEIEQRVLISRVGKPAFAPALVTAGIAPSQNETQRVLGLPAGDSASPGPAPSPADATNNSPPEERAPQAEEMISATAGDALLYSAPKDDAQSERARAIPVTSARLAPGDSVPSTALGRLALAKRAAAQQAPLAGSHLILTVSPWGEVYVDNKKLGLSPPLAVLALPPGKHSVQIRNADLPPYEEVIQLQPDETLRIKHKFK
jgi:hypothetical protein